MQSIGISNCEMLGGGDRSILAGGEASECEFTLQGVEGGADGR